MRQVKPLLFALTAIATPALANGTGVVVNGQGDIVTADHVIDDCKAVKVRLAQHGTVAASIVARDPQNDLALLRIKAKTPDFVRLRSPQAAQTGEHVVAVGYPLSGLLSSEPITTTGVLSAPSGMLDDVRYYQVTAAVQPGNSGGPLLDASGQLLGVVASKLSFKIAGITGDIPENVNFVIKHDMIKMFLSAHGLKFLQALSARDLPVATVSGMARNFTAHISCEAPAPAARPSRTTNANSKAPARGRAVQVPEWFGQR